MTFLLIIVFVVQLGFILFLRRKIIVERNQFQSKLAPLEAFIVQLNEEQKMQSFQLKLTDDLKAKMKDVNAVLNREVFEFNYQLLEDLYPKNEF
jgi:predicted Holliday junction resolvase-like endonuclease